MPELDDADIREVPAHSWRVIYQLRGESVFIVTLVHRRRAPILASAANVPDSLALPHLLHGGETRVYGDRGYLGQTEVIHAVAPNARDFTNRRYRKADGRIDEVVKAKNRTKSQVRAKVEHVIGVIKRVFGFQKTRYRGLAKNLHRLEVMAALTNVFMQRRRLLAR